MNVQLELAKVSCNINRHNIWIAENFFDVDGCKERNFWIQELNERIILIKKEKMS